MNEQKRDFDSESAQWDNNPARVKMAEDVTGAIVKRIALNSTMEIMDFGCGTGLLSTKLSYWVKSVTSVDSSKGMLSVVEKKIEQANIKNIKTRHVDLDQGDRLEGQFDLIISNMTLHHIKDIQFLIGEFYRVLKPNGILCISDLDSDHGEFHGDNTGVFHFGFDRKELQKDFIKAGLTEIATGTAASVTKPVAGSKEMKEFTIFMLSGVKEV
jgi:2-polyprenyl-3-methyl-5-hydroxy-6-metoxy-1,4-benzoquinol methylase